MHARTACSIKMTWLIFLMIKIYDTKTRTTESTDTTTSATATERAAIVLYCMGPRTVGIIARKIPTPLGMNGWFTQHKHPQSGYSRGGHSSLVALTHHVDTRDLMTF